METNKPPLYVITPIFNPLNFKSRIRLYKEFENYMAQSGVILITVEVSFKNRPFEVTTSDNPLNLQLHSDDLLWHKEKCINLGIQHLLKLYPKADKVCWIDADVRFANVNWVEDTLLALDHFDFIQLFSQSVNLTPQNENQSDITGGVFYNFVHKIKTKNNLGTFKYHIPMGHPGLAWGATIEAIDKVGGLIDFCIHGSGDSHMANALMGDVRSYYQTRQPSDQFLKALDIWQEKCDRLIQKNIGYIPGICFHYWHGKMHQRQYKERWEIICDHGFDPNVDIYTKANGLYQFAGNKKQFEHDLRSAIRDRNEDSVDL
jgi:hypothetical protein